MRSLPAPQESLCLLAPCPPKALRFARPLPPNWPRLPASRCRPRGGALHPSTLRSRQIRHSDHSPPPGLVPGCGGIAASSLRIRRGQMCCCLTAFLPTWLPGLKSGRAASLEKAHHTACCSPTAEDVTRRTEVAPSSNTKETSAWCRTASSAFNSPKPTKCTTAGRASTLVLWEAPTGNTLLFMCSASATRILLTRQSPLAVAPGRNNP